LIRIFIARLVEINHENSFSVQHSALFLKTAIFLTLSADCEEQMKLATGFAVGNLKGRAGKRNGQ